MLHQVYLGLGANVGDKEATISLAIEYLNDHECIEVESVSEFVKTKAISQVPQPDFINSCISIKTILSPTELLELTEEIEIKLGRNKDTKGTYDPRPIDIDILFYSDAIVCDDRLTIPHPLIHERDFVLNPLNQIAPDFIHPILESPIKDLYNDYQIQNLCLSL